MESNYDEHQKVTLPYEDEKHLSEMINLFTVRPWVEAMIKDTAKRTLILVIKK